MPAGNRLGYLDHWRRLNGVAICTLQCTLQHMASLSDGRSVMIIAVVL